MKIRTAFPDILRRQYPFVRPEYPLLTVLYLLRMSELDAVPISSSSGTGMRAVFGFSSLPRFMALGPRRFANMLKGPCERASDTLSSLGVGDELESVLEAFASKRLGFAEVHGSGPADDRRSLITLTDILDLYQKGAIKTDLLVKDVSTPMLTMSATSTIRSALETMFRNRYRRVFISERECVSERNVMQYLFSPIILEELSRAGGRDVLSTPIGKLERSRPAVVPTYASLRTAAMKLRTGTDRCLIVGRASVVTPWDVVMKPWLSGKMTIG